MPACLLVIGLPFRLTADIPNPVLPDTTICRTTLVTYYWKNVG